MQVGTNEHPPLLPTFQSSTTLFVRNGHRFLVLVIGGGPELFGGEDDVRMPVLVDLRSATGPPAESEGRFNAICVSL